MALAGSTSLATSSPIQRCMVDLRRLFMLIPPSTTSTGGANCLGRIHASDEWVFMRVHWDHTRDGKRFDQHGVEVFRLNPEGRVSEFWALMRDTAAFDEFFS